MEDDSDLTILPIKPNEETHKLKKQVHPYLPDINRGALALLISPIRSGKSTLISNLLLNPAMYRDAFDIVYIISNTIMNDDTSRFLKEAFPETIFDEYSDDIIRNIINYQKSFAKDKQPTVAIIMDDYLGIKGGSLIYHLASRFRHYNIKLLLFASQLFRGLPPVLRQNATNVFMGGPNPSDLELEKMFFEYGALYDGPDNLAKLYANAVDKRYNFLHLDLASNPSVAYKNLGQIIYKGKEAEEKAAQINMDTDP